jgi:protein pelota
MKITKRTISEKDGVGSITLIPEVPEDLWHLYHIISVGDQVTATTIRKVSKESSSGTVNNERVKITLTIQIDKVDFDSQAGQMRLSGQNITENKWVKLGAYHTIEIEVNRKITVSKQVWDAIFLKRLEDATDLGKSADVAAIILTEGKAHLCLLTQHMTIDKQKFEKSIPKKRYAESHEKHLNKFFDTIVQGIIRHIDFNVVKCILLASPGFTKDQFYKYMLQEAVQKDLKVLLSNKDKFLLVHANSAHKHALKEVLKDEGVMKQLQDTKAVGEVKALDEFYQMLNNDPNRAFYGTKHVFRAAEQGAIQTLLLTDELFRSADVKRRRMYVDLTEQVQGVGGEVSIFSSMHPSGEQLTQLSGIAAILRFPIYVSDDELSESDSDDDDSDSSDDESDKEDDTDYTV